MQVFELSAQLRRKKDEEKGKIQNKTLHYNISNSIVTEHKRLVRGWRVASESKGKVTQRLLMGMLLGEAQYQDQDNIKMIFRK